MSQRCTVYNIAPLIGLGLDLTVTDMKFAHDFKNTLKREDFPPEWVNSAIPYGQLKKCLKRVQKELNDFGLDRETLRKLLENSEESPVTLDYRLNSSGSRFLQPKLTVLFCVKDGVPVDARLSPSTLAFLERVSILQSNGTWPPSKSRAALSSEAGQGQLMSPPGSQGSDEETGDFNDGTRPHGLIWGSASADRQDGQHETIEVPLVFDSEFFNILQGDVNKLDDMQAEEERAMSADIIALGQEVSRLIKPSRLSKSDLNRWRSIFEIYLDAQIFFSTHEQDHGARSSREAIKQLQWFQDEVTKRNLPQHFKLGESRRALERFLRLNTTLLKNLRFQEINRLAVTKILKKFEKRTSLTVAKTFPVAMNSDRLLAGSMAKNMCAQISQELVSTVPQLNDYLCPVCFALAYRPVRLACRHVFCIRCIVKIQRRNTRYCPLCRAEVVMKASVDNLDIQLENFMEKYFPKESKEKQRSNTIERGIEDYGPGYIHSDCSVM